MLRAIEEERHYYPFLGEHSFRWNTDEFEAELLHQVIGMYLGRHLRKNAAKKGSSASEVLEGVINDIVRSNGNDLLGMGNNLLSVVEKLRQGDEVGLHIGLTNVWLRLKRFGTCVGIRANDGRGVVHNDATEILEQMAAFSTEKGGFDYLMRFVHCRSVIVPRGQAYGSDRIDVRTELASIARYVPDVTWRTDDEVVAEELREDYIVTDHQHGSDGGVEVGRYHDIPVLVRILFGKKESDRTWRKGAVTYKEGVLLFDSNSSSSPDIRYFVRVADKNNTFEKAEPGIDYSREQECQGQLAKILFDAFSARDLAESIARTPTQMAWKRAEVPKQETAASV